MARLVRECLNSPEVREVALDLLQSVRAANSADFIEGVRNFVVRSFHMIGEPDELLISPLAALSRIQVKGVAWGDCDDASMLVAALLKSVGINVRFKAIGKLSDGSFSHVFAEYQTPDGWIPLDTTNLAPPVYAAPFLVQEI